MNEEVTLTAVYVAEFIDESVRSHAFSRRVKSLARELSRNGFTIEIVSPQSLGFTAKEGRLEEKGPSISMLIQPPKGNYLSRIISKFVFFFSLNRFLNRSKPDRVIVSFHSPLIGLLSTIAGKIACGRVVFDSHDSWIILEQTHPGETRNRARMRLERLSFHIADAVTTVSPTLKRLIVERYHTDQEKISIIYNGADVPESATSTAKDIDIIHLGSPRIYYDSVALVEALGIAARSVPTFRAVFLGSRDDAYVRLVRDKAAGLGLTGSVEFAPPVPPSEVGMWLARSKVAVYTLAKNPTYSSALGLKLFEYISHGLPIAYLGPLDSEVCKSISSRDIGVTASTSEEFAGKLVGLLLDERRRNVLGGNSRAAADVYSWAESGKRLAQVLSERQGNP